MKLSISRLPYFLFALFAGLLAIALVRHYSSVPYWDMWDGYLDFYNRVLNGDLAAWWYQHNEHRIVLSRLLFWLDIAWFGGNSVFLIVVNFLLAVFAALLMAGIFREMFRGQRYGTNHWLLYTLCLTLPLSWMQEENLTWAFQSQFFLAHIMPLAAFSCFYLSEKTENWRWFLASLLLGIASVGSMANGVVVLPMLAILSVFASESSGKKALIYGISAGTMLVLYFSNYSSPTAHGSLVETVFDQPWGMLKYIALYIGSPLYSLLEYITPPSWDTLIAGLSMVSGFFLMLGSTAILFSILKRPRHHLLEWALMGFIAYIGATAFGSAGGRLIFGLEQALAGRYRTPAILLWLAFLILSFRLYRPSGSSRVYSLFSVICLLAMLILATLTQINGAISNNQGAHFERRAAILAMALDVSDAEQINRVYPSTERAKKIAQASVNNNISIFSNEGAFSHLPEKLETKSIRLGRDSIGDVSRCPGVLDSISLLDGKPQYIKLTGWLYPFNLPKNKPITIVLPNEEVVGYLILGKERPDVAEIVSRKARYSGYYAYINLEKVRASDRFFILSKDEICWIASGLDY